jgi:hypothetical protein
MTRRGRAARATGTGDSRRRELPRTSDLCGHAGVRGGGHRKAPGRLPSAAGTSWELRVSSRSAVFESVKNPGAPVRRVMVRPDASGQSARGDGAGESRCHGSGSCAPKRDSRDLGPWPWNQGARAQASWRVRRVRLHARESARTRRGGVERTQRTRRRVTASAPERALRVETP